jgi:hypothetical protein
MSNRRSHRRGEHRRTEHGPRYENANPGAGCNSTHVARSRRKWKRIKNRSIRRTGVQSHKFRMSIGKPIVFHEEPWVEDEHTDDTRQG